VSTPELWREMLAASDEAIRGEAPGPRADALIAEAHMEAVRRYLFPEGQPAQPWNMAEFAIWRRLTVAIADVPLFLAECDKHPQEDSPGTTIQEPDGEAEAPPATSPEDFQ
jgi:hypothetical protein